MHCLLVCSESSQSHWQLVNELYPVHSHMQMKYNKQSKHYFNKPCAYIMSHDNVSIHDYILLLWKQHIQSPLITVVPLVCVQKQLSWKGVLDVVCDQRLQESYRHLGICMTYNESSSDEQESDTVSFGGCPYVYYSNTVKLLAM